MTRAGHGRHGPRFARVPFLLAPILAAIGCVAPPVEFTSVEAACAIGLQQAAESRDKGSSRNRLLYYMQLGTFQHSCGLYDESTQSFETAKRIGDDLYTRSIRNEAATWLANDYTRAYPGEKFELVLLRVLNAFNYLSAGREEDALVEARQIDFMLRELAQAVGTETAYSEDAFARFLTGMLHEEAGDLDGARISYHRALAAYETYEREYGVRTPPMLVESAQAVAERQDVPAAALASYGRATPRRLRPGTGEVILVHEVGRIDEKVDQFITVTWGEGWLYINEYGSGDSDANAQQVRDVAASILASDTFRVAFPKLERRPFRIEAVRMRSAELIETRGPFVVQDIAAIARTDLAERIDRIRAKTIARAAFYFALKKALRNKMEREGNNDMSVLIEVLSQLRNFAVERADKRQWRTLPARLQLSSAILPVGLHTLELDFTGGGGVVRSDLLTDVEVRDGRRTFVVVRTAQ